MTYKYTAYLSQELRKISFPAYINIPSIEDAKDGFWLNNLNEFTRIEDECYLWIPASQITYVEKIGR